MEALLLLWILEQLRRIAILMKINNTWAEPLLQVSVFQQKRFIQKHQSYQELKLARPESIIGKNTVAAMQSGILYGYVGQVEGIVYRIKEQSKVEPLVIATGGLGYINCK